MMETNETPSPCIGVCNLDGDNVCRGCYRSLQEVQQWFEADEMTKKMIMRNVEQRKQNAISQD